MTNKTKETADKTGVTPSFTLRLDPTLRTNLEQICAKEHRSLSGQISHVLESFVAEYKRTNCGEL